MKSIVGIHLMISLFFLTINEGTGSPILIITNNGPTVLGSYVTFTAILSNYELSGTLTYRFDDGIQLEEYKTNDLNVTLRKEFPENKYSKGSYYMNVTVTTEFVFEKTIISNFSKFELNKDLIGEIIVQRGDDNIVDFEEVAVGENVTFSVELHDPENYFKNAIISYGWSVDYERHQTVENALVYNFTEAGEKDIKAIVTVSLPNNIYLSGYFEKTVTAKVPVNKLNVSGNFFMHHGETLNLNITCKGSPPFSYCFKIMRGNNTSENFTCSHLSTFTTCHMEIMRYFQQDGTYQLGIYISNNVHEIKKVYELMVYSVSVNPTLSTVIIPIVCSLLALVIIAGGIAYFIQHKNRLEVEVANFDFQDESDSYTERTFFESIFDSFTCRNCAGPRLSCSGQSENDPLI